MALNLEASVVLSGQISNAVSNAEGRPAELNAPVLSHVDFPPHPTQSLRFLQEKDHDHRKSKTTFQARISLKVIIVGGGIGGLGCAIALARRGHKVTVLEQAAELTEVGAGLQIPPNSSRLLLSWGVGPHLTQHAIEPASIQFRRWANGDVIGFTKLIPEFRHNFDAPFYVVHRAHYLNSLKERALELGVDLRLGCRVEVYDTETSKVSLADGESFIGDLVVACDGVNSKGREVVLGGIDVPPQHTGFAAYRAIVNASEMRDDPEVSWLIEKPSLNIWIGGDKHVMTYSIAAGESFNMVLSHVDHTDPKTWNKKSPDEILTDMRNNFANWDPCLTKIIGMVEKTLKWPLLTGKPLKKWIAPGSKVIIMGDSAHPMVPYMSQGAGMAIEDGAALAVALSMIRTKSDIPEALRLFEKERILRSSQMQGASMLNGKLWHFQDGPEQRARDERMRPEVEGQQFFSSPNQWSDPVTQRWAYGYDAEAEMLRVFKEAKFDAGVAKL